MVDMIPDHLQMITDDLNVRMIQCAIVSDLCMAAGLRRECLDQLTDANGKTVNSGSTMSELCEDRHETAGFHQCVHLLRGILEMVGMVGITVSGSIPEVMHYRLQWNPEECLQTRHWDRTTLLTDATCHLAAAIRTRRGTRTRHSAHRLQGLTETIVVSEAHNLNHLAG
jgi:hypothetical protein